MNPFRKHRNDRSSKQEIAPDFFATDPSWDDPFQLLRKKWGELPVGFDRLPSSEIIKLSDGELLAWWEKAKLEATTGPFYKARGWYHTVYMPMIKGASVIEIGTGFGIDGLTFAQVAGHYTFVDIVQENLKLLERLARIMKIKNAAFLWLENYECLKALPFGQDVILASGSLHHAPMRVIKSEIQELAPRLRTGGRWLQLAYPKRRWEREGCEPFWTWGKKTDGEATPWAEWYDLEKLLSLFEPHSFEAVMAFDYHDSDFNWFDLIKRS
jgi:hypothetical protein